MKVSVTGGAGYLGACAVEELLAAGHEVRILDVLLHEDQSEVAVSLRAAGAELVQGDIRDAEARRRALDGVDAVVHLAAIVGDSACARDPELSHEVNVEGKALVEDAQAPDPGSGAADKGVRARRGGNHMHVQGAVRACTICLHPSELSRYSTV